MYCEIHSHLPCDFIPFRYSGLALREKSNNDILSSSYSTRKTMKVIVVLIVYLVCGE